MAVYDAINVLGVASKTSVTTASNTTTAVTLHSEVLPANILKTTGRNARVRAKGYITDYPGHGWFDLYLRFGSTNVLSHTSISFLSAVNANPWLIEGDITVVGTNVVEAQANIFVDDDSGYFFFLPMSTASTVSVTLSNTITMSLVAQYAAATSTASISCRIFQCDVGGLV